MKLVRLPDAHRITKHTLSEIQTMLSVLPLRAATVCAVAGYAGLRRSELRGLRWEDYDGQQLMVKRSVWEGFTNEPKTTHSKAPVPVIKQLRVILNRYRLACGNASNGPIFANGKGKLATLNNVLNPGDSPSPQAKW